MKEKIKNQDHFNILQGYYNNKGFHSMGKREIDMNNLLHQMCFNNLDNFIEWYKSLTTEEIKEGKKDWCPGNCCQSILIKLLRLSMIKKYIVKIDDNYHYMDESERFTDRSYATLNEAIDRCKELTIASLKGLYEKGISPEKLSAQWAMFGEDPFIIGGDEQVPFSARSFVTNEVCEMVIKDKKLI